MALNNHKKCQCNDLIKIALANAKEIRDEIKKTNEKIKAGQKKKLIPRMLSVVRDKKSNQIHIQNSGKPGPEKIHPEIRNRMPEESLEGWTDISNCAEVKACNDALWARDDAKMEDLEIATVNIRRGEVKERCNNCKLTTSGATVFTNGVK